MVAKAPARELASLGRYQVRKKIAEGGMGTVFQGHDPIRDKPVALKVLRPEIAGNTILLRRFRQEFKAASTLDHPHIVRGLEFGRAGLNYFMVMEFVDGVSLGEKIERDGPLPEGEAVRLGGQVARALEHAHKHGYLHRDVKPDNILLTPEGDAKLTDLGLAKALDEDVDLTRAGKGLGTPFFMAPEQLADAKTVDQRADVYGLAATLYIAVTGELPFRSRGYLTMFRKKAAGDIKPPRALVSSLTERLDRAVLRALSAEPNDRPASCAEFFRELTGKALEEGAARTGKSRIVPRPSVKERRTTIRYASQTEGVCLPLGGGREVCWVAQVLDVSTGGIRLLVNRRFEPGTVLTVDFPQSKSDRPQCLLVRVVRAEAQNKRKWALGCKFGRGLVDEEVRALL